MDQTIGQGDIRLEATRAVPIIEDISNEVNVLQEACQPLYLALHVDKLGTRPNFAHC